MNRVSIFHRATASALVCGLVSLGLVAGCGGEYVDLPGSDTETEDTSSLSSPDDSASGLSTSSDSASQTQEETVATDSDTASTALVTTLLQTVRPLLEAEAQKVSPRSEWGLTEVGAGEPLLLRDELNASSDADPAPQPTGEPSSLAFFWHLTDSQLIDEESPARLIQGDDAFEAAFRLQESWSTQLLEAAIRTGREIHDAAPFDFALLTGDLIDNIQANELDWLMTVLDGGAVHPDSGKDDDPLPGPANDPHDAFEAMGLGDIPWYFTLGNHDDLILGNFSSLDWLVADPTGDTASTLSNAVTATCLDEPFFDDESLFPERCLVPNKGYYGATQLVADKARGFIDREDWVEALWGSTTLPAGHGLEDEAPVFDYVVELPAPGGPLRLVVLDTVAQEMQDGAVTEAQLDWLEQQLRAAEDADQLVIVASHHPSWWIKGKIKAFVALLQSSPNVVLHISGHEHKNIVVAHPAPAGMPATHGYFEVVTASTLVWPQQTRLVEIVDNRDGTVSVFGVMLDFEIPADMPELEGGRFYGLFDVQAGSQEQGQGEAEDRNVELRIPIPASMKTALAALPYRPIQTARFPVDE